MVEFSKEAKGLGAMTAFTAPQVVDVQREFADLASRIDKF